MIWANIIGLILVALSLGLRLGGRLADRWPSTRLLGFLVLAGRRHHRRHPLRGPALPQRDHQRHRLGVHRGGARLVLRLRASCSCRRCCCWAWSRRSPSASASRDMDKAGSTAGRIFALSTAGSLVGTFLPALVTIPLHRDPADAHRGGGDHRRRGLPAPGLALADRAGGPGRPHRHPARSRQGDRRPHLREGVPLPVRPGGAARRRARLLYLNEGFAVHSIWRPDTVLTGGEWDMFLTVPPLMDRPVKRIAILGNAGGTTARSFGVYYPDIAIDGVEIDPEVNAVAKKYFGADDNVRLNVVTADARPVPAGGQGEVRPHLHRRLPPAVRALLPGHRRLLQAVPRPPGARRHRGPQRLHRPRRRPAVAAPSPARWPPSSRW